MCLIIYELDFKDLLNFMIFPCFCDTNFSDFQNFLKGGHPND